ncbi:MAG: PIG-L deacetylase family protein [Anaerolineae bacterium]
MNTEPTLQTHHYPTSQPKAKLQNIPGHALEACRGIHRPLRLLCVLAHPDDESLAIGGTLARYAQEGTETYLLMGTRGERGWLGDPAHRPGLDALGHTREAELRAAAHVLGLREVNWLGYVDGEVDQADPNQMIARIVLHLRRLRPDVVITFDPNGMYGHPDHIAISQFTAAAILCAADPGYGPVGLVPHRASKFYYRVHTPDELAAYQHIFGDLRMSIDGVERSAAGWQGWAITTRIHTAPYWRTIWEAIACHRTQVHVQPAVQRLYRRQRNGALAYEGYYRVFSTVNGGRQVEADLFEGLR